MDAANIFKLALATSMPDALSSIRTAVEFRFNAATGVSYRIEASTDLTQWDIIEPVIIGQSVVVTRFYSIENQPKRYFRVRRNRGRAESARSAHLSNVVVDFSPQGNEERTEVLDYFCRTRARAAECGVER